MNNKSTFNSAIHLSPPTNPQRWVPSQKQQVLACIMMGKIGFQEALKRYTLSIDELISWYAEHRKEAMALI